MGLLAKGGNQDENQRLDLQLERLVCPVCRKELPPWVEVCPDDGVAVVSRTEAPSYSGPEVPAHLLEALENETHAQDSADADLDGVDQD
jgi:predicted amidophosphoribosyltransferase